MTFNRALALIHTKTDNMGLSQLQEHKKALISAWYESKAEYGFKRAVENGFYTSIQTDATIGYAPRSTFLTRKIEICVVQTEKNIKAFYNRLLK